MPLPNVITARELIELYYGTKIAIRVVESDVTVGTSVVQLGKNANIRTGIALCNTGGAAVAVGFNNGVTVTTGIILVTNQSMYLNWQADGEAVSQDLWAISSASGNGVHVIEYVLSGL